MWVDDLWAAVRRAMALSVAVTLAGLVTARNVDAQAPSERVLTPISRGSFSAAPLSDLPDTPQAGSIRRSLEKLDYRSLTLEEVQAQPSSRRSVGRKILGGALGAFGGFFAGGYIGARIDGDCGGCDDPGLKGAVIGAPIGAVVGGILGAKFF